MLTVIVYKELVCWLFSLELISLLGCYAHFHSTSEVRSSWDSPKQDMPSRLIRTWLPLQDSLPLSIILLTNNNTWVYNSLQCAFTYMIPFSPSRTYPDKTLGSQKYVKTVDFTTSFWIQSNHVPFLRAKKDEEESHRSQFTFTAFFKKKKKVLFQRERVPGRFHAELDTGLHPRTPRTQTKPKPRAGHSTVPPRCPTFIVLFITFQPPASKQHEGRDCICFVHRHNS